MILRQIIVYFKSTVSNKILEFVKIYAIKSYTNNKKLLLLIKKFVIKVIFSYLLTFTTNKLCLFISYIYLATMPV